jgi:hypothetical protein
MFKKNNKTQSQSALNSLNTLMNNMNSGGSGIGGYVNYPTSVGGYSYPNTTPGTWTPSGPPNGLFVPGSTSYHSCSRNYFHTPKFIVDVSIVNLEEFKKYKNEGIVYYDNILLPFNEFYKLVEDRYNKRVPTDLNEAVENYNKYVQDCEDKFNLEAEAYKKFVEQEIEDARNSFKPQWATMFKFGKVNVSKPKMPNIGHFTKPEPPQLEINLTVPCDCEVCLNKLKEVQDDCECLDNSHCGPSQVCLNGQCVPIVGHEFVTLDYNLNPYSVQVDVENPDNYFPKTFKPEELEQLVNDIKRNRGTRNCNTVYSLNPLTFKIDEDVAQEYFEKIASVHDHNKNLYNPGSLNTMEINAYIERLKLNFIDKMIEENDRKI